MTFEEAKELIGGLAEYAISKANEVHDNNTDLNEAINVYRGNGYILSASEVSALAFTAELRRVTEGNS